MSDDLTQMSDDLTQEPWPERIALIEELCDWQTEGGTVREFLREPGRPSKSTLYRWVAELERQEHPVVGRFARAKEAAADAWFEEMREIANADPHMIAVTNEAGDVVSERVDPGDVQNRKLRVYVCEQMASKINPRRYGTKVGVEHSADTSLADVIMQARERALAAREEEDDE